LSKAEIAQISPSLANFTNSHSFIDSSPLGSGIRIPPISTH
jgi:hypothetical protein